MKLCKNCNETKKNDEFYKDKKTASGLYAYCKKCAREKTNKNRADISIEKKKEYNKTYYTKNKDKLIEYGLDYKRLNPVKCEATIKEWRSKNREYLNEKQRKYASTINGKASQSVRRKNRRKRIKETDDGTVTTESLIALEKKQNHKCHHCEKLLDYNTPRAVHLDHLLPLSKGGQHTISNVRWSCAYCNISKGTKLNYTKDIR